MDLNRVATFIQVVERGSFTAAAAALGLPKSSVSRSVTRLEEDLGVMLLQRTTRKLALTDAGRAYFERSRQAVAAIDEATALAADAGKEPSGIVRMAAPMDFNSRLLAEPVARFVRANPRIHVDVVFTSRSVDLVEEGIDLALHAGRPSDSSLVARRVGSTLHGLFASPTYLRRRGSPKDLADLAKHDCIGVRGVRGKHTWRLHGPHGEESVEVTGPTSADEWTFALEVALEGLGIALLPAAACMSVEQGRLAPVLPEYSCVGTVFYLVAPGSRHVPHRVALLWDFLVASLGKTPCLLHSGRGGGGGVALEEREVGSVLD